MTWQEEAARHPQLRSDRPHTQPDIKPGDRVKRNVMGERPPYSYKAGPFLHGTVKNLAVGEDQSLLFVVAWDTVCGHTFRNPIERAYKRSQITKEVAT